MPYIYLAKVPGPAASENLAGCCEEHKLKTGDVDIKYLDLDKEGECGDICTTDSLRDPPLIWFCI